MKKWILPGGMAAVLFLAVAGGAFALTGGLDDNDGPTSADSVSDSDCSLVHNLDACDNAGGEGADDARCAEGASGCGDASGDALGVCISEDDPAYGPEQPCNDTAVNDGEGDGSLNMCIAEAPDCNDTIVDTGDQPITSGDGIDPDECSAVHNIEACEVRVHEIVIADMETNVGAVASIVSTEFVEWPNACLGVELPDVACAEVITSGFKVVAEAGGQQYEYHTDLNGGFVIAN